MSPSAPDLGSLLQALSEHSVQNNAPVHLWDPPFCGDLDMIIQADGRWDYNKTPIGREKLVRLFASVLKREGDDYFLVTPVEKIGIQVVDVPFIVVAMERFEQGGHHALKFTTNVGDQVIAGPDHELSFEKSDDLQSLKPYVHIRGGLKARLSRPVYYELANQVVEHVIEGNSHLGVWSSGQFYQIESLDNCQPVLGSA